MSVWPPPSYNSKTWGSGGAFWGAESQCIPCASGMPPSRTPSSYTLWPGSMSCACQPAGRVLYNLQQSLSLPVTEQSPDPLCTLFCPQNPTDLLEAKLR